MTLGRNLCFLMAGVVLLAVIPLIFVTGTEFPGADGLAEEAIFALRPGFEPWASLPWEPPGGETESMLFVLQAALGAGFLGYYFGLRRGEAGKK
ncbi:MAG: Cobalt transport protein CbiN [Syntrophomonadaceae bacterium]|nr:Cobalt transport protein CbiN [Bacillota bacterium]